MRKKLTNKEKFQFREEEVLPSLPRVGRNSNSVQSRLARKVDNKVTINEYHAGSGHLGDRRHGAMEGGATPSMPAQWQCQGSPDPVLDQIVAKLKSGLTLLHTDKYQATGQQAAYKTGPITTTNMSAKQLSSPAAKLTISPVFKQGVPANGGCICLRPLKLVMCEVCGETFRARVSLVCSRHPRAIYLQDVKECKGCKQTNKQALKEFDLPLGMVKRIRGIGSN